MHKIVSYGVFLIPIYLGYHMIKHINPYIRNSFEVGTRDYCLKDEEKSNMGNFPLKTGCLTSNIVNKRFILIFLSY